MGESEYQQALEAATSELQELLRERVKLDDRIAQVNKAIEVLNALLAPAPGETSNSWTNIAMEAAGMYGIDISEAGITDAIRQIVGDSKNPLTPPQIRDALVSRKVELTEYANPLAVIHNTLSRLEKQGEIVRCDLPSGTVYTLRNRGAEVALGKGLSIRELTKGVRFGTRYKPRYEK